MNDSADVFAHNRDAWNSLVAKQDRWTIPVTSDVTTRAARGDWQIVLTPEKSVPRDWFGNLAGSEVLCLASGGGQQAPILAAAGARVTVFDASPAQLAQDRFVAERDGLQIRTVEGNMADLSCFADESFDLIFHPCSNCFAPDIRPVWREAARVLRVGGAILSGICRPIIFLFDDAELQRGNLKLRYSVPHNDLVDLSPVDRQVLLDSGEPVCFGHSLQDQIGGQIDAGLAITGFYEDVWSDESEYALIAKHTPTFIATRATKLARVPPLAD